MLVINKKRIKIILAGMLIAVFTFTFQIAQKKTNETTINNVSVQTTATPVSGKTVVIDAGHGAPDE